MKKKTKAMTELEQKVELLWKEAGPNLPMPTLNMSNGDLRKLEAALKQFNREGVKRYTEQLMLGRNGVKHPSRCLTRIKDMLHCVDSEGQKFVVQIPQEMMEQYMYSTTYDPAYSIEWRKKHPNYHKQWKQENRDKVKQYEENWKNKIAEDPKLAKKRKAYLADYYRRNRKKTT